MSNSELDVLGIVGCRDNNARRFARARKYYYRPTAGNTEKRRDFSKNGIGWDETFLTHGSWRDPCFLPAALAVDRTTHRVYKICLLVHKSFVGHVPDYIIDLLTPDVIVIHHGNHYDRQAAAISSWGGQDDRWGTERSLSHLESSSYRAEDHAIDYCIQETSENFF